MAKEAVLTFGPIPSRRLGHSLGVSHIPPKACSYSCVYCQVGPTLRPEIEPRAFHAPQAIISAVTQHVEAVRARGQDIDYISFVPDGEPTLDVHLGEAIDGVRTLGIPVAVITNGSLLWREDVRARLWRADWVCVKVDTTDEATWRALNQPHADLALDTVLDGIRRFSREFGGKLTTDTMLVDGVNDDEASVTDVAAFLETIHPRVAYIALPIRPPAVPGVRPASEEAVTRAYHIFSGRSFKVELLTGYEESTFAHTGDAEADLLGITTVHPMREESVRALLTANGAHWDLVESLMARGELKEVAYQGHRFYVRRIPRRD